MNGDLSNLKCSKCGSADTTWFIDNQVLCYTCAANGVVSQDVLETRARKAFVPKGHPEKDFSDTFDQLATLRGWTWCGFRPARQKIGGEEQYRTPIIGQKGLPDRVLARNGQVLLVEFKTDTGRLSDGQKVWDTALNGFAGYYVVRPSDWEQIERILA